jgi:hypothetical protein
VKRQKRTFLTGCTLGCWLITLTACEGPTGPQGRAGDPGLPGQPCWDSNANGAPDLADEDRNGDGQVDALDCLGDDGTDGVDGVDGVNGNNGSNGAAGLACWDLDGNGQGDPGTEDRNGDGAVDVLDCAGSDGSNGNNGINGRPCWDLDGDGQGDLPAEDLNADGVVDVLDCAGISTGTLTVTVRDATSGAYLGAVPGRTQAALVELDPPVSAPQSVTPAGQATFERVPAGIYSVVGSALAIERSGDTIVETDRVVGSLPVSVNIVAGSDNELTVYVPRLPPGLNLTTVHDQASGGALYVDANCITCHGDRKNEVAARDGSVRGWHSIVVSGTTDSAHVLAGCVFCHDQRVDVLEVSGASLRRQVALAKCTMCHTNYPALP